MSMTAPATSANAAGSEARSESAGGPRSAKPRLEERHPAWNITGERLWLWLSGLWRYPVRWLYRRIGAIEGSVVLKGWWPFAKVFLGVVAFLALTPILLHYLVDLLNQIGVTKRWGIAPAPDVKSWLTPTNVVVLFAVVVFMRWLSRARERVVVESFIDHTKEDATAVSGLSDMLVTELTRLRELYNEVNAGAVPTAVGVERQGGFSRGKEAASFLSVAADNVSDALEGAVASDASLEIGGAKIPIGMVLRMLNRIARGPRIVGSVHRTEAGGGPTLTAQLVRGKVPGTWRVDQEHEPASAEQRRAFLDSMVRELACRIFTEVTLGETVRWQAVQAFNEYLRLYGESSRTPRDRARGLKAAQGKLLEAIAEDENFDLAFYNLGVTYIQLAQAELNTERSSDDVTSPAKFERRGLVEARRQAAGVAFKRATEKKPERWEAHYALAVTRMSALDPIDVKDVVHPDAVKQLWEIIRRCKQTLALKPPRPAAAAASDLMGMAQTRVGEFADAMSSHREAVRQSWLELCRAEREYGARPEAGGQALERSKANCVAALHNLGLARQRRAVMRVHLHGESNRLTCRLVRRDRLAAARMFKVAIRVAGEGTAPAAAAHFERARALEDCRKSGKAVDSYHAAEGIHPDNPEYVACEARVLASWGAASESRLSPEHAGEARRDRIARAQREATLAFRKLALDFGQSVMPLSSRGLAARCDSTLTALEKTYKTLDEISSDGSEWGLPRIRKAKALREDLEEWSSDETANDEKALAAAISELTKVEKASQITAAEKLAQEVPDPDWELTQVRIALARLHALSEEPEWEVVEQLLAAVLEQCSKEDDPPWLVGLNVRAQYARALRRNRQPERALAAAAECIRREPLSIDGRREAGRAHFDLGEYSDALDAWCHALFLNPSDAYLHFEIAMCHLRIAEQRGLKAGADELEKADQHLHLALELFDGEELDGEAWTRLWRGRIELERRRYDEAVACLEAATHGSAELAAMLFLAEAYVGSHRYVRAKHVLDRALKSFVHRGAESPLPEPLDARWGDALPRAAFCARWLRAYAEARFMAAGDAANEKEAERARDDLRHARNLTSSIKDDRIRESCLVLIEASEARIKPRAHSPGAAGPTKKRPADPAYWKLVRKNHLLELLAGMADGIDQTTALAKAERRWGNGNSLQAAPPSRGSSSNGSGSAIAGQSTRRRSRWSS